MGDEHRVGHKRYAELVRKLLALTGTDVWVDVEPALRLALVGSLDKPEHSFLAEEFRLAIAIQSPAVVGEQAYSRLKCTSAGRLLIVEAIVLSNPSVGTVSYQVLQDGTDVFTASQNPNGGHRERRFITVAGVAPVSGASLETGSSVGFDGTGPSLRASLPLGGSIVLPVDYEIDVGRNVQVQCGLSNQAIDVSWVWRERTLERYEARR